MRERKLILLVLAIVCFVIGALLIAADSSYAKDESILLYVGLALGFASFLP